MSRRGHPFEAGADGFRQGREPPADADESEGWYYAQNAEAGAARHIRRVPDWPAERWQSRAGPEPEEAAVPGQWSPLRRNVTVLVASALLWACLIFAVVAAVAVFGGRP